VGTTKCCTHFHPFLLNSKSVASGPQRRKLVASQLFTNVRYSVPYALSSFNTCRRRQTQTARFRKTRRPSFECFYQVKCYSPVTFTSFHAYDQETGSHVALSFRTTSEVLKPLKIQVEVVWVMTPCNVKVGYRCFGGPCRLHFQG